MLCCTNQKPVIQYLTMIIYYTTLIHSLFNVFLCVFVYTVFIVCTKVASLTAYIKNSLYIAYWFDFTYLSKMSVMCRDLLLRLYFFNIAYDYNVQDHLYAW